MDFYEKIGDYLVVKHGEIIVYANEKINNSYIYICIGNMIVEIFSMILLYGINFLII